MHTKEEQIVRTESVCLKNSRKQGARTLGGRKEDQQVGRMNLWERTGKNKSVYKPVRMKAIGFHASFKNNNSDYDNSKKQHTDPVLKAGVMSRMM